MFRFVDHGNFTITNDAKQERTPAVLSMIKTPLATDVSSSQAEANSKEEYGRFLKTIRSPREQSKIRYYQDITRECLTA
jgi:hypothetical protein